MWSKGTKRVAIEVKNSRQWRRTYSRTINELVERGLLTTGFVVYRGDEQYRAGQVSGLPVEDFLAALHAGSILG